MLLGLLSIFTIEEGESALVQRLGQIRLTAGAPRICSLLHFNSFVDRVRV